MAADSSFSRGDFLKGAAGGALAASAVGPGAAAAALRSVSAKAKSKAKREWLFVQTAKRASWKRKHGANDVYTLVLEGVSPQTVAFTDRPYRDVHTPRTGKFLKGLNFGQLKGPHGTPTGGPNAAILAPYKDKPGEDVLVVALYEPLYDASHHQLIYEARPLHNPPTPGMRSLRERRQNDFSLPERFDDASLFIDSCGTSCWVCRTSGGPNGTQPQKQTLKHGMCWSLVGGCGPCGVSGDALCLDYAGNGAGSWFTTGSPYQC